MFIEFDLSPPTMLGGVMLEYLQDLIHKWSTEHQIPYTQKRVKYTHRLAFNQDDHYTVFAMTWKDSKIEWRIVDRKW